MYIYTVWNIFKPDIVEASWNCEENDMKNKCIVDKAFFSKFLFETAVPLNMRLWMQLRSATV